MKEAAESNPPGSFYFVNLGCPKNLVDAEIAASMLEADGWCRSVSMEDADLIVITTCAFIRAAVEESIDTILSAASGKREGQKIAVLGCLVSREKGKIEKLIPEVDYFLDVKEMYWLSRMVAGKAAGDGMTLPRYAYKGMRKTLFTPRHLAYLKISEGCSNHCTYCLIPSIRGEHKSYRKEDLIDEAKRLSDRGVRELVVIAQDSAVWGEDIYNGYGLSDLLKDISSSTDFHWIRLMYLHPAHVEADKLIELISEGVIIPYLDVPIQHVSDRILRLMRRGYGRRELEALFTKLRREVPNLVLRTTVMVGFPSETEEDFSELLGFIEEYPFEHLGAFVYSKEAGTVAADMTPQVPEDEAEERLEELLAVQMDISESRLASMKGGRIEVIVDSLLAEDERPAEKFTFAGRYYGQAYEIDGLTYVAGGGISVGDIVEVKVEGCGPYDLFVEA